MNESARYFKIVEWSDEDNCYVGSCPDLFYGGCHGDGKIQVCAELHQIVDEWLEILRKDGQPLPPANLHGNSEWNAIDAQ